MTALSPAPPALRGVGGRLGALILTFGALLLLFLFLVRPWYLHWGASAEEALAALPGDELAPGPVQETRAIDIQAPAEHVFAWVAQLGQNRAGFYSYELLEDLVGCEMPDVRHLDPALQRWRVGDKLWMYPPSKIGGRGHATLIHLEPERALVFGTNTPTDPEGSAPTGAWSFVVSPTGPDSSRLLTRASGGGTPSLLGALYTRVLFEPIHFAMERRMLEGIKGLAEGRPISPLSDGLQLLAWGSSFVSCLAAALLVLGGKRFWRSLSGVAVSGVVFQIVTLLQPPPLVSLLLALGACLLLWPLPRRPVERGELAGQIS